MRVGSWASPRRQMQSDACQKLPFKWLPAMKPRGVDSAFPKGKTSHFAQGGPSCTSLRLHSISTLILSAARMRKPSSYFGQSLEITECGEFCGWEAYLNETASSAAPASSFHQSREPPTNQFRVGFRLSCRHPNKAVGDCLATISSVEKVWIVVEVDQFIPNSPKSLRFVVDDPALQPIELPVSKSSPKNPRHLNHRENSSPEFFAPKSWFNQIVVNRPKSNLFEVGQKLEVASLKRTEFKTFPATIVAVHGDNITIHFDGLSSKHDFQVPYYSKDIFPAGYSSKAGIFIQSVAQNHLSLTKRAIPLARDFRVLRGFVSESDSEENIPEEVSRQISDDDEQYDVDVAQKEERRRGSISSNDSTDSVESMPLEEVLGKPTEQEMSRSRKRPRSRDSDDSSIVSCGAHVEISDVSNNLNAVSEVVEQLTGFDWQCPSSSMELTESFEESTVNVIVNKTRNIIPCNFSFEEVCRNFKDEYVSYPLTTVYHELMMGLARSTLDPELFVEVIPPTQSRLVSICVIMKKIGRRVLFICRLLQFFTVIDPDKRLHETRAREMWFSKMSVERLITILFSNGKLTIEEVKTLKKNEIDGQAVLQMSTEDIQELSGDQEIVAKRLIEAFDFVRRTCDMERSDWIPLIKI
ncbi:unnamed protein product [Caenorhabditis auriculariae]|uniref:Uncharacterized protein n=1 Tax=Caenorhabditis auriculariae TaxID=2777116 RepID=A0A8S1HRB1_9PELO|nr:unnamed protein product [Caenorhabditis auriculariae]